MSNKNDVSAEVVFEYTGEGCVVPKNVTIVRFHPSVVEVENKAFHNCNKLREVIFNDGLQKIGRAAFYYCTTLSSIKLPSTVTEIGEAAFEHCNKLRGVIFNDGLHKIGVQAFRYCTSLSTITLPSTVTEIGDRAFYDCSNLREVGLNEVLQKIGAQAFFHCTSLSTITLPSTVTKVDNAFGFYHNLTEVMMHGVPREIGEYEFDNCTALERFTFPTNNLREVVLYGVPREIGKNAFSHCTSFERFTFPTISTRLGTLIQTGHWEEIENEVNEVRGVIEWSNDELIVSAEAMEEGRNWWNQVKQSLDKIIRLISCYELKEATSILELALWKFKLDQVDEANPIPRKKCRMDVPGPVKDIILQYLPYECLQPVPDIQS